MYIIYITFISSATLQEILQITVWDFRYFWKPRFYFTRTHSCNQKDKLHNPGLHIILWKYSFSLKVFLWKKNFLLCDQQKSICTFSEQSWRCCKEGLHHGHEKIPHDLLFRHPPPLSPQTQQKTWMNNQI